jgi:Do/DeqQ family serine protease
VHSPFARVAEIVSPSVVFIDVRRAGASDAQRGPFHEFFRDFVPRRGHQELPGSGSGFVMDERGFVMTNNHVVEGGEQLRVTFLNGQEYAAEIVGQDPRTDVAVLRITEPSRDGTGFPALVLGDSDEILIGDWAIAVGNPFGAQLAGSVTVGVISAKGRAGLNLVGVDREVDLQDFIQTDASINFGNSGGPLVNIRGEVIGVNTAINALGQGIGFAIPVNMAADVAQQLIDAGRVRRGYLGIRPVQLTRARAEEMAAEVDHGILVQDVFDDSPAEQAGLRPDDIIVEYDGRPVTRQSEFRILVAGTPVGNSVQIRVYREDGFLDLEVTLGEYKETAASETATGDPWLGLSVEDLRSRLVRERFSLQAEERGVVVTEVDPESPAAEKGLEPGIVILEITDEDISSISDYNRVTRELRDRRRPVTLKIKEKDGTVRFVNLTPRP